MGAMRILSIDIISHSACSRISFAQPGSHCDASTALVVATIPIWRTHLFPTPIPLPSQTLTDQACASRLRNRRLLFLMAWMISRNLLGTPFGPRTGGTILVVLILHSLLQILLLIRSTTLRRIRVALLWTFLKILFPSLLQ